MNESLKDIGKVVKYEQDDIIFFEGEKGDAVYILLSGSVIVCKSSQVDGSTHVLAQINSGSIFGEMAVIKDNKRTATIIAREPSMALRIDQSNFGKFIMLEPKYAVNMLKTLASRIDNTQKKCEAKG